MLIALGFGWILTHCLANVVLPVTYQGGAAQQINLVDTVLRFCAEVSPDEMQCLELQTTYTTLSQIALKCQSKGYFDILCDLLVDIRLLFQCCSLYRIRLTGFIVLGILSQCFYYYALIRALFP
jgi:hypothetical protein